MRPLRHAMAMQQLIIIIIIFIRLKISTSIQKISEASCQRGKNTHQRWPPLQLSDIIQIHKCTKKYKKRKTQPVHKPTTVRAQKKRKKIFRSQHTAQTVLTCPHITTGSNGVLNTF